MQLILFGFFNLGKMWKNMEKQLFFQAATVGLGKYCMGSYSQIEVYRVKFSMMTWSFLKIDMRHET